MSGISSGGSSGRRITVGFSSASSTSRAGNGPIATPTPSAAATTRSRRFGPPHLAHTAEAIARIVDPRQQVVVEDRVNVPPEGGENLPAGRRGRAPAGLTGDASRKECRERLALEERLGLDVARVPGVVDDAEVQLAALQTPHLVDGRQMRHLRLVVQERPRSAPRKQWSRAIGRWGSASDPKGGAAAARPAGLGDGDIEAGEGLACLVGQDAAGLGGNDDARRTVQELDTELALELADRLGEGRLRDPQAVGRPAEVQLLHHRQEVAEVPEADRGRWWSQGHPRGDTDRSVGQGSRGTDRSVARARQRW